MATIDLINVSKSYGHQKVVHGVDLHVDDGEFVVFLGPSGCGKSTTLRMIAGLEEITSGTLKIGGRDVTRLEPKDRNIAMVFQNYALYPHKTVAENMGFALRMQKVPAAEIRQRVQAAAEMLDLGHLLDRKPKQLSGGQMQRVALGRALVREPDTFLLDEPLSNLDAKLRVRMREEIGRLHRKIGTSMVYVTHDQIEAMTLADRIVIMRDGHVQQVGKPLEIYDFPANPFVAGFIGASEMNLFDGRIEGGAIRAGGLCLPSGGPRLAPDGTDLVIGIRPEHIALRGDTCGSCVLNIQAVEQLGTQTLCIGEAGGVALRVLTGRRDNIGPGMALAIDFTPGSLHCFERSSGKRLATAR